MPLEKFFQQESLNVKDFILGVPRQEQSEMIFDPARDISEETWNQVLDFVGHYNEENFVAVLTMVQNIKIIDPKKESLLKCNDDLWSKIKEQLNQNNGVNFYNLAVITKHLFPERMPELHLDDTHWQALKTRYTEERHFDGYSFGTFLIIAAKISYLFPEKIPEMALDNALWERVRGFLVSSQQEDSASGFL